MVIFLKSFMPIELRVKVVGIGIDNDPFTGVGYTSVQLAVESDIPAPPLHLQSQYPPTIRPTIYKHVLHVFVPTSQWKNQYQMWSEYNLVINDDGQLRLNLINETDMANSTQ